MAASSFSRDTRASMYEKIRDLSLGENANNPDEFWAIIDSSPSLSEAENLLTHIPQLMSYLDSIHTSLENITSRLIGNFSFGTSVEECEAYKKLVHFVFNKYENREAFETILEDSFNLPPSWLHFKTHLIYLQEKYELKNDIILQGVQEHITYHCRDKELTHADTLDRLQYVSNMKPSPLIIQRLIRNVDIFKDTKSFDYLTKIYPLQLCHFLMEEALNPGKGELCRHKYINLLEQLYQQAQSNIASLSSLPLELLEAQVACLEKHLIRYVDIVKAEERGTLETKAESKPSLEKNSESLISKRGAIIRLIATIELQIDPAVNKLQGSVTLARLQDRLIHARYTLFSDSLVLKRLYAISRFIPSLKLKQETRCKFVSNSNTEELCKFKPLTPLQTFIFSDSSVWRLMYELTSHSASINRTKPLAKRPLSQRLNRDLIFYIASFLDPLYLLSVQDIRNVLSHVTLSRKDQFCFFEREVQYAPAQKKLAMSV